MATTPLLIFFKAFIKSSYHFFINLNVFVLNGAVYVLNGNFFAFFCLTRQKFFTILKTYNVGEGVAYDTRLFFRYNIFCISKRNSNVDYNDYYSKYYFQQKEYSYTCLQYDYVQYGIS